MEKHMNVECKICGLQMKDRINGSHLKYKHGITIEKYIEMFPTVHLGTYKLKNKTFKREYGEPKPVLEQDRHIYIEDYDYCNEPKDASFESVNIFDEETINDQDWTNADIELDDAWAPKDWS